MSQFTAITGHTICFEGYPGRGFRAVGLKHEETPFGDDGVAVVGYDFSIKEALIYPYNFLQNFTLGRNLRAMIIGDKLNCYCNLVVSKYDINISDDRTGSPAIIDLVFQTSGALIPFDEVPRQTLEEQAKSAAGFPVVSEYPRSPRACQHLDFSCLSVVSRLTEEIDPLQPGQKMVTGWVVDLYVSCKDCGMRMKFLGPTGYSSNSPRVSASGFELRAPMETTENIMTSDVLAALQRGESL